MSWDGVITNAGTQMLAAWTEGVRFNLDYAAAGAGTVKAAALLAQTALVDQKQTVSIITYKTVETGQKVKVQLTAAEEAYQLQQIGLWGSLDNGPSHMIALFQNAEPIPIPSVGENPNFVYTFFAGLMISNTKEFSVTVDGSAFVTESTLLEFLAEKQDKFTGRPGQVVGFDEAGNPVAQEAPDTGVFSFNGRTGAVVPEKGDYTAADVGARPNTWTPTAADVGAVPTTRTVNGKALSADISLTAADVDALPSGGTAAAATKLATARTISLTGDVTGSTAFDGTANKSIAVTLAASGVTAGTYGSDLFSDSSNSWFATNKGIHSSTAQTVFTLKKAGTVTFTYSLNSESSYDKFTVTAVTGGSSTDIVSAVSGTNKTGTITTEELAIGDTITFKYVKDSSNNTGQDTVLITALKFTATGSTSSTALTQKTLTTYFTVSNNQYYFAPVSNTGPVVPIPRFTVDAKGRITSAENTHLPLIEVPFAQKLTTARTIRTNLASTSAASFDGSANITPGVTGTLPITNGGTGASTAAAACANIGALPLAGGTMTGPIYMPSTNTVLKQADNQGSINLWGNYVTNGTFYGCGLRFKPNEAAGAIGIGLTTDGGVVIYPSEGTYTWGTNCKLKGIATPESSTDAANKSYVDSKFTSYSPPYDGTVLMNYNAGTISDGYDKSTSVTIPANKKYLISLVARVGIYYTSNVLYLNSNELLDSAFYFMNTSGSYKGAVTIVKEASSRNLGVDLINKTGSSASNCSVSIIVLMELS